jgi:hypothetical protein
MANRRHLEWSRTYYWGKNPRKQFAMWHIPRAQVKSSVIRDDDQRRFIIARPDYEFDGMAQITSGRETKISADDVRRLRTAVRLKKGSRYSFRSRI